MIPAIALGVLAVPVTTAQAQEAGARSEAAIPALDGSSKDAARKVGAGQITEIGKQQGDQGQNETARAGKSLADTVKRSGGETDCQACPTQADGRARAGDPVPGIGIKRSGPANANADCKSQAQQRASAQVPVALNKGLRFRAARTGDCSAEQGAETQRGASGIEKSDIRNGRPNARTGGFEAEYSGATGGVASRVTDSGEAPAETPTTAEKAPPEG